MKSEALQEGLPGGLQERVRPQSEGPLQGDFVLYWMRSAVRAYDNPCIEVAHSAAQALGLPFFVYQGLSERYPFASDRHHRFILEGAQDAHRDLSARGVACVFHCERPGHRGPHLKNLAKRAALVITEDVPVPPLSTWTRRLAESIETPVWRVDASCLLPMRISGSMPKRAFQFRKKTEAKRIVRVKAGWDNRPIEADSLLPVSLGFEPVDLARVDVGELIAQCDIDHSVGPVPSLRGGRDVALRMWQHFKNKHLSRYASKRNNAALLATSRLSPWLHHGHISPFQIALEAFQDGSKGAQKFLDELLIWRELAWAWCFHQNALHSTDVIPEWARQSLLSEQSAPRDHLPSWETLSQAKTPEPLWNLAQESLLRHGELHNNMRMTWGKALVGWTKGLEESQRLLVDLNHRYALDGRDPSSYGGLYWCLGLFDRPFHPPEPIFGSVRSRSIQTHAERIDVAAYERLVHRPIARQLPRIAVIGAGLAGLRVANILQAHGLDVEVHEKSRGPSGRMSTRRAKEGALRFDHGAQYFRAKHPVFTTWVDSWHHDGVVAPWRGRFGTLEGRRFQPEPPTGQIRWVGVPGMSHIGRQMSRGLVITYERRIEALERDRGAWYLVDSEQQRHGPYDQVLLTAPAAQTKALLTGVSDLERKVGEYPMVPSMALMLAFDSALELPFDGASVDDSAVAWLARNSSKPGRGDTETWVLQSSPGFAEGLLEQELSRVEDQLLFHFRELTGVATTPTWCRAHRWRYARSPQPISEGPISLFEPVEGLGVAGDWLAGQTMESAWLSATALAGRVLNHVAEQQATVELEPNTSQQLDLLSVAGGP